jgi:hypothetical protein
MNINVEETTARLAEIEAERETLLETLRSVSGAIGEVLSCYTGGAPAPKTPPPPAKKAPAERAPRTRIDELTLVQAVEQVRCGDEHKVPEAVIKAAVRRGLLRREGRGDKARHVVAT